MPSRVRERLTFANVVSVTALFVALGGSAWAVSTVGSEDIRANAIKARHIKAAAVGGSEIRADAVTSDRVLDGSLLTSDFADPNGLAGADGADGSPDTPGQVLDKVKTMDGTGSGLDADTIDGLESNVFERSSTVRTYANAYNDTTAGDNSGSLVTMFYDANADIEVFAVCYDGRAGSAKDEAEIHVSAPANSSLSVMRSDGTHLDVPDFSQAPVVHLETPNVTPLNLVLSASVAVTTPDESVLTAHLSGEVNDTASGGNDCAFGGTGLYG
jgi:hypothetical protein